MPSFRRRNTAVCLNNENFKNSNIAGHQGQEIQTSLMDTHGALDFQQKYINAVTPRGTTPSSYSKQPQFGYDGVEDCYSQNAGGGGLQSLSQYESYANKTLRKGSQHGERNSFHKLMRDRSIQFGKTTGCHSYESLKIDSANENVNSPSYAYKSPFFGPSNLDSKESLKPSDLMLL